ncbi:helix-turn-helix domain-containing protein [Robertmurraya kyonggiensis]|uniref:Helix-turn-helix transcriptional regulator n=1 Tax=Robertmurraya kyonggiensis TaxID=1037680 RepID=A0A4U1CXJ1_9BACI|nr:helix-turn-helix transcriptional regulator [Robertmurraya kyonggiensis]TKC14368.1 helix-turn-helix transcriptional regulator [Robertmurraya kyonggiensis]
MGNLVKLVGINIREIRKMHKLTQEELSEKSGLQTSYLAGVERGERNITLETLEKILSGLEVDARTVFSFNNVDPEEHFSKKEVIELLMNLLVERNIEETKLIYKLTKEIFETYKIDKK